MLTNVNIVSAVRFRPLIQVSSHVPYFSIIFWHYLCWNLIINVAKLSVCNRSSLTRWCDWHSWMFCTCSSQFYFLIQWEHIRLNAYNWQTLRLDPKSTTWSGYEEIIRSLNHRLYISSDQSHSVKTSYINRLSKTFRLFSPLCENCNIKTNVHSQLLLYMTYMSSCIWVSRWSAYIYN